MDHSLVNEIAKCIIAAWAVAVLPQLGRQPLILAHLAAVSSCGIAASDPRTRTLSALLKRTGVPDLDEGPKEATDTLPAKRAEMDARLKGRNEVLS